MNSKNNRFKSIKNNVFYKDKYVYYLFFKIQLF